MPVAGSDINELTNAKRQIAQEWIREFPSLNMLSTARLLKVTGCFIQGIELTSLPHGAIKFRPHFVIYPLWKNSAKECLQEPSIVHEFKNAKGLQYNIPYIENHPLLENAITAAKIELKALIENTSIESFFRFADARLNDVLVAASPVMQAKIFELIIFSAMSIQDDELLVQQISRAKAASHSWAPHLFDWKFGSTNKWIEEIENCISNSREFNLKVETNIKHKTLAKLNSTNVHKA
jgi:hypothetical protein